jgi:hypothetical protein
MDLFAKLLHALAVMPWANTPDLTVWLEVAGDVVRLVVR